MITLEVGSLRGLLLGGMSGKMGEMGVWRVEDWESIVLAGNGPQVTLRGFFGSGVEVAGV